jgi:KaiC/GvpD/RAD55 family RecA-like ATPase
MSADAKAVLVNLADVQPEQVRWLRDNRVPYGKVTIFAGDPGLGKSFVALDLAARVSREGDRVILLSAEDDPADTIRPRLDAAGADVSRVELLQAVRVKKPDSSEADRMLRLDNDLPRIREVLESHPDTKLLIIDPLSAYFGDKDSKSDEQVRSILSPLAQLAAKTGIAIVCVKHLNKDEKKSDMYRAGGSIGFVAAARVVWMFGKDKDDPELRFMLLLKSNIGPDPGGLAFRIKDGGSGLRVEWQAGSINIRLEDALRSSGPARESALDDAKQWLRDELANGPRPATEVKQAAKNAAVSIATLRRAVKALSIKPNHEGFGPEGKWMWSLPKDAQVSQQEVEHLCEQGVANSEGPSPPAAAPTTADIDI